MTGRFVLSLLAFFVAALIFTSPVFAESGEGTRRIEAKKTILIPWSKDAKTSELGLSPEATKMLDLWLDYGRNKYGKRAKPSPAFTGVPHEVWKCEKGTIELQCNFVSLVIDSAIIPISDSTKIVNSSQFG